ncbi:MAG: hypothetical protein ACOX6S_03270 [Clostridia bacterium]
MLVAEKNSYLYETYLPEVREEIYQPQAKAKPKAKAKVKIRDRVVPILSVFLGCAVCALIVSRYAQIAVNHSEILESKKALAAEQKITEDLKLRIAMAEDLDYIRDTAKEKLGMDFPQQNEIRYVKVSTEEKAAEVEKEQKVSQKDNENILDTLISLLD